MNIRNFTYKHNLILFDKILITVILLPQKSITTTIFLVVGSAAKPSLIKNQSFVVLYCLLLTNNVVRHTTSLKAEDGYSISQQEISHVQVMGITTGCDVLKIHSKNLTLLLVINHRQLRNV